MGGAHTAPEEAAASLKEAIISQLDELTALSPEKIRAGRYAKFRKFGEFSEVA